MASMRIDREQKRRFDRLQARLFRITGQRVTQAELLEQLLRLAEESLEKFAPKSSRPLTEQEIKRVLSLPMDLGFELGDVDEGVYGKRKRTRS